ncbi:MAG: DUF1254 domain-containing protein [Henriciella sp.]|jgi:uncharacterized membrane protein|nr:DUF1254 domain-containing protein [Henriciella sp.]
MLGWKTLAALVAILAIGAVSFWAARSAAIDKAPKDVIAGIQARVAVGAGGWNACLHNRQFGPVYGGAARANPDSVVSIMAYDLADGPVRVAGETWPDYWSLSLYEQNSDAFYVLNDREIEGTEFELILKTSAQQVDIDGAKIVTSPSPRGIMLIRRFVKTEAHMPGILENQDRLSCAPLNS